jgi:hypothetical protein
LCNQTLSTSRQAHHDDAYPRVFGLYTGTVSLSQGLYEFAGGHCAHVGRIAAIGLCHCVLGASPVLGDPGVVKRRVCVSNTVSVEGRKNEGM